LSSKPLRSARPEAQENHTMRDVIQRILDSETEAKKRVAAARQEGERIVAAARQEAEHLLRRAREDARVEAERLLTHAIEEAIREKRDCMTRAAENIEAAVRLAPDLQDRIVAEVVRCVTSPSRSAEEAP
jgi:vacuolar-type H+-ATPase subunit H